MKIEMKNKARCKWTIKHKVEGEFERENYTVNRDIILFFQLRFNERPSACPTKVIQTPGIIVFLFIKKTKCTVKSD